jgi:GNAT superfamily N-acetyltransferase
MPVSTTLGRAEPKVERVVAIRRAQRSEMRIAADIIRSTAEWYRPIVAEKDMAEHSVDDEWAARNFLARECYLGRIDDEAVGFVTLQHCGEYAYVGYAYVPDRLVGRGIGRQLLSFAARVAKERGYRGIVHIAHPNTVARAYGELARDGVIESRQGRGMYVSSRRVVYSGAERSRRLERSVDSLIAEAYVLGYSADELMREVANRARDLDARSATRTRSKTGSTSSPRDSR